MKKAWEDVKSFVTVIMTIAMVILLFVPFEVNKEVLMIFSSSFGSVMTYFFTKKNDEKGGIENGDEHTIDRNI